MLSRATGVVIIIQHMSAAAAIAFSRAQQPPGNPLPFLVIIRSRRPTRANFCLGLIHPWAKFGCSWPYSRGVFLRLSDG